MLHLGQSETLLSSQVVEEATKVVEVFLATLSDNNTHWHGLEDSKLFIDLNTVFLELKPLCNDG